MPTPIQPHQGHGGLAAATSSTSEPLDPLQALHPPTAPLGSMEDSAPALPVPPGRLSALESWNNRTRSVRLPSALATDHTLDVSLAVPATTVPSVSLSLEPGWPWGLFTHGHGRTPSSELAKTCFQHILLATASHGPAQIPWQT